MIAYLILVHRFPEQFKRLFRAIYDPANHYVIHVDKNSGPALEAEVRAFLGGYANTAVLEGRKAMWGGYSLVDAELRGMAKLLAMNPDWETFINLSGQDFPLKTQGQIADFLERNRGKEFIRVLDQKAVRPDTMNRVRKYVVELGDRLLRTVISRPFLSGATPYIGNQWMMVSRAFCEFVCDNPRADRFKAFYRHTLIPDEGFFQTVMMNGAPHGEIVSDDMRMIDWVPDGDIKLRPRTFTIADTLALITSPALFARKFDLDVDGEILTVLERRVNRAHPLPPVAPVIGQIAA